MLEWVRFTVSCALMLSGIVVLFTAVAGIYKFNYVLNRMHAAAIGDTLGLMLCLLSLTVSALDIWMALKLLLIICFLWLASPVGSHLIARLEVTINPIWHQLPPPEAREKGDDE